MWGYNAKTTFTINNVKTSGQALQTSSEITITADNNNNTATFYAWYSDYSVKTYNEVNYEVFGTPTYSDTYSEYTGGTVTELIDGVTIYYARMSYILTYTLTGNSINAHTSVDGTLHGTTISGNLYSSSTSSGTTYSATLTSILQGYYINVVVGGSNSSDGKKVGSQILTYIYENYRYYAENNTKNSTNGNYKLGCIGVTGTKSSTDNATRYFFTPDNTHTYDTNFVLVTTLATSLAINSVWIHAISVGSSLTFNCNY